MQWLSSHITSPRWYALSHISSSSSLVRWILFDIVLTRFENWGFISSNSSSLNLSLWTRHDMNRAESLQDYMPWVFHVRTLWEHCNPICLNEHWIKRTENKLIYSPFWFGATGRARSDNLPIMLTTIVFTTKLFHPSVSYFSRTPGESNSA